MPARALYVVAYDVRDPTRLRRVLEVVRAFSTGGQKSVHECWLEPAEVAHLVRELEAVIDPEVDSLVLVRPERPRETRILGIATRPEDRDWFFF